MNCKNCSFWKRLNANEFVGKTEKFGECESPKNAYYSWCDDDKQPSALTPDMLLYADTEGYGATLYTGQDFGCVNFKEK